jgi:hypothetical protein
MSQDTKDFVQIAGASSSIGAIYADRGHADNTDYSNALSFGQGE